MDKRDYSDTSKMAVSTECDGFSEGRNDFNNGRESAYDLISAANPGYARDYLAGWNCAKNAD